MTIPQIQINKKLPMHSGYQAMMDRVKFLRLSFEANAGEYVSGSSPDGPIVPRFDCEEQKDYNKRLQLTPVRSYVNSILVKYNSSIFRVEPTRAEGNPVIDSLYADANGDGQSLNELMSKTLLDAQIDGRSFLMPVADDGVDVVTVAQKNDIATPQFIKSLQSGSVVNWSENQHGIYEAIVILVGDDGDIFGRYMNDDEFIDVTLNKELIVQSVSEPYAHGYARIPLVTIEPFTTPQSLHIAYSQKTIVNSLSLLNQENIDSVFTKYVLSGVRLPQEDPTTNTPAPKISYGSKRMIVLEDQSAKLDQLGADSTASTSLRDSIKFEEENMYLDAGFGNTNLDPSNLSGYALSIVKDDFFIKCGALKSSLERAENEVKFLIATRDSSEFTPVAYSNRFIADDQGLELAKLRDLLALPLPTTFKNLVIKNYINTYYNVPPELVSKIESELSINK